MVVGEVAERADVVVIGGGPGGYAAALRCADDGAQVILVEREAVGGVCLNVGCIPSKVLIHAADVAALPARSADWGVSLDAEVDLGRIHAHSADVVERLTGGVRQLLDAAGVEIWTGEARFSRADRLAVVEGANVRHLEFARCIVATGSRPTAIASLPFDGDRIVDSTDALRFAETPEHLVVVGGGYIGIELGTAWAKLGARVTIVESEKRVLPAMDPLISREVGRRLSGLGVEVLTNARATSDDGAEILVTVGEESTAIACDRILVAVGRTPNSDDLGLDTLGITLDDDGHIEVGPDRRASKRLFAIGDVTSGPALAHKATAEAEVVADAIAGRPAAFAPLAIPEVVFCDPEVANVGHSPASAAEEGIETSTFRFPFAAGSRSRTLDDTAGFVQLVADDAGTIIGAQLIGAAVSELVGEVALAIELCATAEELASTIHPHPTMSEGIAEAALGLIGRPLHVRRKRR